MSSPVILTTLGIQRDLMMTSVKDEILKFAQEQRIRIGERANPAAIQLRRLGEVNL